MPVRPPPQIAIIAISFPHCCTVCTAQSLHQPSRAVGSLFCVSPKCTAKTYVSNNSPTTPTNWCSIHFSSTLLNSLCCSMSASTFTSCSLAALCRSTHHPEDDVNLGIVGNHRWIYCSKTRAPLGMWAASINAVHAISISRPHCYIVSAAQFLHQPSRALFSQLCINPHINLRKVSNLHRIGNYWLIYSCIIICTSLGMKAASIDATSSQSLSTYKLCKHDDDYSEW